LSEQDGFVIEKLRVDHAQGLLALLNDPVVARWLGGSRDMTAVRQMIDADRSRWESLGYGTLVAVRRSDGRLVARAAVRPATLEGAEVDELLYTVAPSSWGRSLATELSQDVLRFFFDAQPYRTVTAFTLPENVASVRVMTKLGLGYNRDVVHAGLRHVLYAGTAEMIAAASAAKKVSGTK
jgi:RimJ/RimL family protein N-acetyltransferase